MFSPAVLYFLFLHLSVLLNSSDKVYDSNFLRITSPKVKNYMTLNFSALITIYTRPVLEDDNCLVVSIININCRITMILCDVILVIDIRYRCYTHDFDTKKRLEAFKMYIFTYLENFTCGYCE